MKEPALSKPWVCVQAPPLMKGILIRLIALGPEIRVNRDLTLPLSGGLHELSFELENRTDYAIEQVDVKGFSLVTPGGVQETFGITQRVCGLGVGQRVRLEPIRVSLPTPGTYSIACELDELRPAVPCRDTDQWQTLQWIESREQIGRGWSHESKKLAWLHPFTVADRVAYQQARLAKWAIVIAVATAAAAIIQVAKLFAPGGS